VQLNNSGDAWNRSDNPVKKQQKAFSEASTTSAYNTGESCRSTPLTLELNQLSDDSEKGWFTTSISRSRLLEFLRDEPFFGELFELLLSHL
jgi:hypothetical protein